MLSLWLAIVIIFYFLSGYWLWKLINIFYYGEKEKDSEANTSENDRVRENIHEPHFVMSITAFTPESKKGKTKMNVRKILSLSLIKPKIKYSGKLECEY